ncbi:MAG: glycosyltransferase [Gammaproteobacteria bacterium]
MKKKVFFVLPSLSGGGAEKFIVRLANAFADRGFDTYLILITNISDDYLEEVSSKVKLIRLGQNKIICAVLPLTFLLRQHKPDVILSTMTHLNVLCLLAKLLSGINSKIYVRSATVFSRFNRPKDNLAKLIAKFIFPFASGMISPSRDVYEDSLKLGLKNKNMTVIYNFVDKTHLEQLAAMPTDLPDTFGSPLILAAGRLTKQKNHAYLIRSFHTMCQQYDYPNAKLIILGKGPEQAHLEQLILELHLQDKVFLKGFLNNPYPYFAKADLFVHTSMVEGLANVLLAALALECNIVTTDCPGAREALNNGTYGRVIPVTEDIKLLAQTMHDALQKPISKSLLAESIKPYSVDTIVNQYIEFMGLSSHHPNHL